MNDKYYLHTTCYCDYLVVHLSSGYQFQYVSKSVTSLKYSADEYFSQIAMERKSLKCPYTRTTYAAYEISVACHPILLYYQLFPN